MLTSGRAAVVLLLAAAALSSPPGDDETRWTCIWCMCDAMSDCKQKGCHGDVCGIFDITQPFWKEAGALLPSGFSVHGTRADYKKCTLDPMCSYQTVDNYMEKFKKDCDKNGVIDCYDLLAIHQVGAGDCERVNRTNTLFRNLDWCLQKVSA